MNDSSGNDYEENTKNMVSGANKRTIEPFSQLEIEGNMDDIFQSESRNLS